MYLIVKCNELNDQWECDADREPLRVVIDYSPYKKYGYEVYKIDRKTGNLTLIQEYNEY